MPISPSLPIKFSTVKTEYSGPANMRGYLLGSAAVPNNGKNSGIPASGNLKLQNFLGGNTFNSVTYDTGGLSGSQPNTVPAGATTANIMIWGAGAGGSIIAGPLTTSLHGSGSGGFCHVIISVTGGTVLTINVGVGGTAPTGSANAVGGNGGTTTISGTGVSMTAHGGTAATVSAVGAGGVVGTGGSTNTAGNPGTTGVSGTAQGGAAPPIGALHAGAGGVSGTTSQFSQNGGFYGGGGAPVILNGSSGTGGIGGVGGCVIVYT